ncbi:MAG TPA: aminotransferase class I/II-fold pyridoxal phosphate-dependent enzyme [Thermoanaerobaculia bacterium]|jgi:methionine-gamma-lyase|nr:aminotransferase class I/II-fold pyridoxal phosphate-dependent enzyme [Thermoanaerobaculia bacterium]
MNKHDSPDDLSIETLLIQIDRELSPTSAVAPPIYQTSTFRSDSAQDFADRTAQPRHPEFYTRFGNPTLARAERVLAVAEGAEAALVTASGMAAATGTVLTFVEGGSHIVAQANHYGGTTTLLRDLLPKFGVETTWVDQRDSSAFEKAMRPNTKLVLVESPSNPVMQLTDLAAVARIARSHGALTIADNTFATPLNQRPIDFGIDIVFHSATKYFGGHSDIIAGAVMGTSALIEKIWNTNVVLGASLAPFNAWLMLRGLRTLPIRVRQQNENALALAEFLARHPAVQSVHYPGLPIHPQHDLARKQMKGFGGMLSFEPKGGFEAARRFLDNVRLASRAASLGGAETLVVHAASNFGHYLTSEQAEKLAIGPGLVRVSVGLENVRDLIADFDRALA